VIISRLNGGLGNQLFQYACGRALSLASGVELVLDLSRLGGVDKRITRRDYELGIYALCARATTPIEALNCRRALRWGRLSAWMAGLDVWVEAPSLYLNLQREVRKDTLLAGFWQSELCFANYAAEIWQELMPVHGELSAQSTELVEPLTTGCSVAIHVRRGDYVSLRSAAQFHGTLPASYYQETMQRIKASYTQPLWVVFSDDIEWCRDALPFLGATVLFVDHNQGRDAWQDLYLMSLCKHHIIANSSFSWWGAWLSEQRGYIGQMIYAPRHWFKRADPYALFRVPERWKRI
jgi:hypothetical protein